MKIKYIKNKNIDRLQYDRTLQRSFNVNIFAYSWYLDLVCDDWDLLADEDYETVCPLPLTRRLGFPVVHQPEYAPFLGVYSPKHLPTEKVSHFLKSIPQKNIRLTLNHYNRINEPGHSKYLNVPVLDMIMPYDKITERYSDGARDIINKKDGTFVMRSIRTDEYLFFRKRQKKDSAIRTMQLTKILSFAIRYKSAGIYSVYSPVNELIGAAFFIKSNNRLFLMDSIENDEGKEQMAIFRALDHLIKNNCESNLTLELPFDCHAIHNLIRFDHHQCQKYKKGLL